MSAYTFTFQIYSCSVLLSFLSKHTYELSCGMFVSMCTHAFMSHIPYTILLSPVMITLVHMAICIVPLSKHTSAPLCHNDFPIILTHVCLYVSNMWTLSKHTSAHLCHIMTPICIYPYVYVYYHSVFKTHLCTSVIMAHICI